MLDLKNLSQEINSKIQKITDRQSLESLKTFYLGKKGVITEAFKSMGKIDADQRKNFAAELNSIKTNLVTQINVYETKVELKEIEEKLISEKIDITLPAKEITKGKIHPVSQVIDELTCIFAEIGFSVAEGPDVENEFNNFTALNTPEHHPARDMHDTFYLDENKKTLLRTHTSPVQIRTMLNNKPPIKIIAPGRTYRCDSDMTHTPMFHQLEGLHIDKDVNMGNLKGCLDFFLKK
ncbi:MAG: phenylalanine--tRNA ligase subunit alpha, partial [alpha proteobacterium HIMB114]